MSAFLKKVLLFFMVFFIYAGIIYFINSKIIEAKIITKWNSCNIVVAGDSHTQRAIDPNLFYSAINISQTAEPYYITFWKLKRYFSRNTTDTVLLGFSYHNLSTFNDEKLSDKFWSDEMFKRAYSLKDMSLVQDIKIDKKEFYKIKLKNMCLYPNIHPFGFKGGYSNYNYSKLSNCNKVIQRHYFYNNKMADISKLSISYLDSIINLCDKENVKLVVITTPLHYSYLEKIPDKFVIGYNMEKDSLEDVGVSVIDMGHKKYKDRFFLNPDHLNKKGALKFTKEIILQFFKEKAL